MDTGGHAVQQGDGKAMLERLAAKTKTEVFRLEREDKEFAGTARAGTDLDRRPDELRRRLVGDNRTKTILGSMTAGREGSCTSDAAGQGCWQNKKNRQELRQKKHLLRETEAKLARQNQSTKQRLGQCVQSSQMVTAAEGEIGSIFGAVTDVAGNPVADVFFYVYTSNYNYAGYGYTAEDGSYTVSGLRSGSYSVSVFR